MMEIDKLDSEVQVKLEVPEDFNPWNVTDASEFLKYHCPECPYQDSQLDEFSNHALQNHERSKVLFGTSVITVRQSISVVGIISVYQCYQCWGATLVSLCSLLCKNIPY